MSSTPPTAEPKRALVTGGTGFVGSNLVRHLLRGGHTVGLLVREGHDPWRLADVAHAVDWMTADLEDPAGLRAPLSRFKPQWVFHLAAHGAYSWQTDSTAILRTNVMGTANLLEACFEAGFEAFVNTGSSSEYGFKDHPPREDEMLEPASSYAVAKAAATLYCAQAARAHGAPVSTLRLYSVYGPWEDPRRFISRLVAYGSQGRLPPLASPLTARDYVYVSDVCDAYLRVAGSAPGPGAVYNVGTGVQTTLRDAVQVGRRVLGIAGEPVWQTMPDRSWDTGTWVADSSRLRAAVGWRPLIDLAQGLRLTADWLAANPDVKERYLAASS
ncbi:MAG TPA: NAD-dependent epimerase/dehydratase family protein [Candidatus Dormibacteraeota bacterium]|nr:NAD-dependent epimerase/dehydratase family protein [Candidatus Dormibacteraeota bacterium]